MEPTAEELFRIRALIPDTDEVYGENGDEYLFSDEMLTAYFYEGRLNTKWAAGLARTVVGGSEALILKVIKNYETSTDGASLMKQWQDSGRKLIDEARQDITEDGAADFFSIEYPGSDKVIYGALPFDPETPFNPWGPAWE